MSSVISHAGIVDTISKGMVVVRITQKSACSSCKVASQCSSSESKEKLIEVKCSNASEYNIGQSVTIMAAESVGMKAVLLAFVIPTILLLCVIFGCVMNGLPELTAALSGIVTLIPYYIVIYLCRNKIERMLTFYLA